MDPIPLSKYIKSIEAFKAGKREESEKLLADALGLAEPTKIMKQSLPRLVDADNPNIAVLTLLIERIQEHE